jgi:hypothetical protein
VCVAVGCVVARHSGGCAWSTLGVVHILALRIPFTRMWTIRTTGPSAVFGAISNE